jgi:SAM-dependent methyltransferase
MSHTDRVEDGSCGSDRRRAIAAVYEAIHQAGNPEPPYHAHTTAHVSAFLRAMVPVASPSTILDAGCGGLEYLDGRPRVVGIDLVSSTLSHRSGPAVVGDIHSQPFAAGSFECVVCVGSVANYLDLRSASQEFARVLAPRGRLILEYERSRSWLTLGTRHFSQDDVPWLVEYNGVHHVLRLYSDRFVDESLRSAGFTLEVRRCFHHLPPFIYEWQAVAHLARSFLPITSAWRRGRQGSPAGNAIALYSLSDRPSFS